MLHLVIKHSDLFFSESLSYGTVSCLLAVWLLTERNFPTENSTHLNLQKELQRWKNQRCIIGGRIMGLTATKSGSKGLQH